MALPPVQLSDPSASGQQTRMFSRVGRISRILLKCQKHHCIESSKSDNWCTLLYEKFQILHSSRVHSRSIVVTCSGHINDTLQAAGCCATAVC